MTQIPDHPIIQSAHETGYAPGTPLENQDSPEHRREYVEDNAVYFVDWLFLCYPEIAEEYVEENADLYKKWLN